MNEKLKEFFEKKEQEELKRKEEAKEKTLIDLGLFEKVYSPDNNKSDEFSCYEYATNKYFKKVPIEVTDEEYEEVKKYYNIQNTDNEKNPIATILRVIAVIIYIAGFIASFFLGVDRYGDVSAMIIVWWIVFFISGTIYLGFAEIIQLLDDIKKK